MKKLLGQIISGSLSEGFVMKINSDTPLEDIKTGKFVSIVGKQYKFFSLITNLKLEVTNPDILLFPPSENESFLNKILKNKDIYASANLKPMLTSFKNQIMPVKTIPPHFSYVYEADNQDIKLIFGNEEDKKYFNIGTPLDMSTPICIDLEKLTERSNGIFGKTGTGKTFLTRLVLAGLIKNEKAVNLIFDMHNEYGFQSRQEGKDNVFVKGLKALFPNKIAIFSLDPASTRRRGSAPDVEIYLTYQDISIEDILSMQDELNLHATAHEALNLIYAKHQKNWLKKLLENRDNLKDFAEKLGAHPESINALYRKLKIIEKFSFIKENQEIGDSMINQMMDYIDNRTNIIVEFGNHTSNFCYLLIANIISRKIHKIYIEKTERFLGSQKKEDEPQKLLITIEEAHKFLNPQSAKQTIFGRIAREMRKYYVSLLIVDQRPSCIDPEIISQIGTKIIALLNDEKDIQSALTGIYNSSNLRTILASLDSKKQALIIGHAVPMPVVLQTREYGMDFYRDIGINKDQIEKYIEDFF